jgi:hypothetical protein
MSIHTDIADAVAAELNNAPSGTFSLSFTARRRVWPTLDVDEMGSTLYVDVVPVGDTMSIRDRGRRDRDIVTAIGVRRRVSSNANDDRIDSEVANLLAVVDEIMRYMDRRPLSDYSAARWGNNVESSPIYDTEALANERVFVSAVRVTHVVTQSIT